MASMLPFAIHKLYKTTTKLTQKYFTTGKHT